MANISDILQSTQQAEKSLNSGVQAQHNAQYQNSGIVVNGNPSSPDDALPFSRITPNKIANTKRNLITWFVPNFGTVDMFVNPNNINYTYKKLITPTRTKGGYTVQYWGEELPTLTITGTTGSYGVEGINMLYEIYRAEQLAFDADGLTIASSNQTADLATSLVGGLGSVVGSTVGGWLGNSNNGKSIGEGVSLGLSGLGNNSILSRDVPSLAQYAFGIELYFGGWVFRGFFTSMTVTEKANDFLIDYNIGFTVTERRGYRLNYLGWQRTPTGNIATDPGSSQYLDFSSGNSTGTKTLSYNGQIDLPTSSLYSK